MERRLHLVESGPFAPQRWPSIALASAELRRPRRLHVVRGGAGTPSTAQGVSPEARAPLPSRRQ
jgi:hypothetical protein